MSTVHVASTTRANVQLPTQAIVLDVVERTIVFCFFGCFAIRSTTILSTLKMRERYFCFSRRRCPSYLYLSDRWPQLYRRVQLTGCSA